MTTCSTPSCSNQALYRVGAKLWATGYPKTSTPAKMWIEGLVVCIDCQHTMPPFDEFFPEPERMLAAFAARGKVPPDPKTAEWTFKSI